MLYVTYHDVSEISDTCLECICVIVEFRKFNVLYVKFASSYGTEILGPPFQPNPGSATLASVASGRSCVAVEKDSLLFIQSKVRVVGSLHKEGSNCEDGQQEVVLGEGHNQLEVNQEDGDEVERAGSESNSLQAENE